MQWRKQQEKNVFFFTFLPLQVKRIFQPVRRRLIGVRTTVHRGSCEVLFGEMSFQPCREDTGCLCHSDLAREGHSACRRMMSVFTGWNCAPRHPPPPTHQNIAEILNRVCRESSKRNWGFIDAIRHAVMWHPRHFQKPSHNNSIGGDALLSGGSLFWVEICLKCAQISFSDTAGRSCSNHWHLCFVVIDNLPARDG